MSNNDAVDSQNKNLISTSVEENVKLRIIECKKLDIHNLVLRLFSGYSIKTLEKFGISEFKIDIINVFDTDFRKESIEILKSDGFLYHFLKEKKENEKYSTFSGVDETTISLLVNSSVVFRSKWRCSYNMEMDFDSTDYPEEILSYIPGAWSDDLLEISIKKADFEKEQNNIAVEKAKIKKIQDDKANFGL